DALYYEFKYGINAYLRYLAAQDRVADALPGSLTELIEVNQRNADLVLSRFGQEIFEAAEATSGDLADPEDLELPGAATRLADAAAPAGRNRLAHRHPGLADRLRARRPYRLRHLKARGGLRLAGDPRPVRLRVRAAGGRDVRRPPVERTQACRARLRLRTGSR